MKEKIINKNSINEIFYKTNPRVGISLIVLVITIIIIIILAAAVIVSIVNNNPMSEANKARITSDLANMQMVFTNAVGKVMAENKDTIKIEAGPLNTVTSGAKSAVGNAVYTLSDGTTGEIIFDILENNGLKYYTGSKLPLYKQKTTWYVDEDGIISLEVGNKKYGDGKIIKAIKIVTQVVPSEEFIKENAIVKIEVSSEDDIESIKFHGNEVTLPERVDGKYVVEVEVTENGEYEIEVAAKGGGKETAKVVVTEIDVLNEEIDIKPTVTLVDEFFKTKANMKLEITYSGEITSIKINGESVAVPSKVGGKYTLNKEVTENGDYEVEVIAKDGTVNKKIVNVSEIEKLNENIKIDSTVTLVDEFLKTKANMKLEITYSGEITSIKINGENQTVPSKVSGKYTLNKEVTENGNYKVEVIAKDGTKNRKIVQVSGIEKLDSNIRIDATVSPTAGYVSANIYLTITYSGEVSSVKINNESQTVPSKVNGKYSLSKGVTENGNYEVEVVTKDGKKNRLIVIVNQITEDMEIWNKADMESFRNKANSGRTFAGRTVTVMSNFDLQGNQSNQWVPINNFAGTFNGNRHTISGLFINNSSNYQGLFGENQGIINFLKVKGTVTTTGAYAGGIAGRNLKKINGCINEVTVTASERSGGICGTNEGNESTIQNSGNTKKIVATAYTAAGITAGNYGTATKVIGCYNTGEIVTPFCAGGICASSCNNSLIDSCYNTGTISTSGKDASNHASTGGITGMNYNNSTVQYCYNTGNVTAAYPYVAGIVGYNGNSSSGTQTVKNVFNGGIIKKGSAGASKPIGTSSNYVGYLIGRYGSLSGIYANIELNTFKIWNSSDIQNNLGSRFTVDTSNKNNGYPILSWQLRINFN